MAGARRLLAACGLSLLVSGCCVGFGGGPTGIGGGVCTPRPRFLWLVGSGARVAAGHVGICEMGLESEARIVLAGIRCPGQHEYLGAEAWAMTGLLAPVGERVRVRPVLGDSYFDWSMFAGTTHGYVYARDGTFVNEELVREGYATVAEAPGLPDVERLRAAEREARAARRGLWHEAWTPLALAVRDGDLAAVEALLDAGADVNAADPFGYTPLMLAHLALGPAARPCDPEIVETLLAHGADPDAWGWNDRSFAAAKRTFPCFLAVSELLTDGRSRAVVAAAKRGGIAAVSALAAKGFDVNGKSRHGWTPLMVAARLGDTRAIEILVEAGADLGAGAADALVVAVQNGRVAAVSTLLTAGADVNARDSHGWTPAQSAEDRHNYEILVLLREAGAIAPRRR